MGTTVTVSTAGVLPGLGSSVVVSDCEVDGGDTENGVGEEGAEEVEVVLVDGGPLVLGVVVLVELVVVGASWVGLGVVVDDVVVEEVVIEDEVVVVVEGVFDDVVSAESKQLVSSFGWIIRGPALAVWLALSCSSKFTVCPAGTGMTQGKSGPFSG